MFQEAIVKIIQALPLKDLKSPKKLLAEFKKYCSPYEERVQYVQLEAMLAGIYESAKKGKEIKLKY